MFQRTNPGIPKLNVPLNQYKIAAGLDEQFRNTSSAPFALAIYQKVQPEKYHFRGIQRTDGKTFSAKFRGGPGEGEHTVRQPIEYGRETVYVPVLDGKTFDDDVKLPDAVAKYVREEIDGEWLYRFLEMERGNALDECIRSIQIGRAHAAVRNYYANPTDDIWSKAPTGDHKQVAVELGERCACVDERIAPLIVQIWRLGMDTLGSCQNRISGENKGKAYVGFSVPGEGERFHARLRELGFRAELMAKTSRLKHADLGDVIEIPSAHVLFSPDDIESMVNKLKDNS
ncbi:MAG: hypothetical protein R6U98_29360 [Pirellulaceae bacterium]